MPLHPKTVEFLYVLLWTCETLAHPTFRNLDESFEAWAYRRGFGRQLERLERRLLIQRPREDRAHSQRGYRLTELGRTLALGGPEPRARWDRPWDGRWRLVVYDVPETAAVLRNRLRQKLRAMGFGFLQRSVWVTPDPVTAVRPALSVAAGNVRSFVVLEARPASGETDAQIVAASWDFAQVEQDYAAYRDVLAARPRSVPQDSAACEAARAWLSEERRAWQRAAAGDPFLPARLLPADYTGRETWAARCDALSAVSALLRRFRG